MLSGWLEEIGGGRLVPPTRDVPAWRVHWRLRELGRSTTAYTALLTAQGNFRRLGIDDLPHIGA
jgi:hypothetical protein